MTQFITTTTAAQMRNGINVAGEITKLSDVRTVNLKAGGTVDTLTATLTDEAGEIALQLWADDIAKIKVGSRVKVLNGFTNEFKGQVSLSKGKFGQLEIEG
jgi:replication factor A1